MARSMSWAPLNSMSYQLHNTTSPTKILDSPSRTAFGSSLPTTDNTNLKAGISATSYIEQRKKSLESFTEKLVVS